MVRLMYFLNSISGFLFSLLLEFPLWEKLMIPRYLYWCGHFCLSAYLQGEPVHAMNRFKEICER